MSGDSAFLDKKLNVTRVVKGWSTLAALTFARLGRASWKVAQ
jgi:hypothetical protein